MLVFSVLLAELVNANEPRVLLFLLIRLEMGRGWGSCTVLPVQSLWPGDADLLEPSWGWGRADPWGGGWMGVRCPSAVGRADTSQSRQRKPFALELPDAENKSAL